MFLPNSTLDVSDTNGVYTSNSMNNQTIVIFNLSIKGI